ncbi:GreA/GreB family elongation factor [Pseudomonas sp. 5P_3.1_Bac2]|uniref:GreA/GreB family elongation factor n=1 Tax=Pseudomonas sp. 5P_3.1_Bac2 TaxID=2971617 RepID=UPI0021C6E47A|nr:GreA/GreB family elongation factor [Pseudomonas sp. 5P_3.1_Bac2]MCU1718416.1 GreA/GreB family elongation factor [Pseudomonas sp. 5P_3.1_Bac2]
MPKHDLIAHVLQQLEEDLRQAQQAALVAYEAATHEENIAENKYDTLGLEASYLATGQARRSEEIRQALSTWKQLVVRPYDERQGIELGALITLADANEQQRHLLLGPSGAAMAVPHNGGAIQVIGRHAPLGQALLGKQVGDEVRLQLSGKVQLFEVLAVD